MLITNRMTVKFKCIVIKYEVEKSLKGIFVLMY
jgi:hypothetical protein